MAVADAKWIYDYASTGSIVKIVRVVTLFAAITTSPATPELFKMCVGASILLPIMFWLYIRFAKMFMEHDREKYGR